MSRCFLNWVIRKDSGGLIPIVHSYLAVVPNTKGCDDHSIKMLDRVAGISGCNINYKN